MNAAVPAETLARALTQAALLRRVGDGQPLESIAALATELGRDKDNTRKSVVAFEKEGLIVRDPNAAGAGLALTELGRRAVLAADVAQGRVVPAGSVLQIPHGQLQPNPLNPRKTFDPESLRELAESIDGAGIFVPLLVFPPREGGTRYLAAGERRWRAVEMLMEEGKWALTAPLPCLEVPEEAGQAALIGLIENGQREDLDRYDQAKAYVALMEAKKCSAREAARLTGKPARTVQEAVQVVKKATEEAVADFKAGRIRWEDLRDGVREHAEAPAVEAQPEPTRQVDIEDLAPRSIELTPTQVLILHELKAAAQLRPAKRANLGLTVALESNMDVTAASMADVPRLISEGLIAVMGQWPTCVALLKNGEAWLASQPGAFMEDAWKLRRARLAAGATEEGCDCLEAEGEFLTPWLNVRKPPLPPQISDEDALILLELFDWKARQKKDDRHNGAPVRHDFDRKITKRLSESSMLYGIHGWDYATGIWKFSVGHRGEQALRGRYPDLDDAAARSRHRKDLHSKLMVEAPKGGNGYATPWLNGLIGPDPAYVEKREREAEAERRAEESKRKAEAANAAYVEKFAAFSAEIRTLELEPARDLLSAFLREGQTPAPWHPADEWQTHARAATGASINFVQSKVARALALMCVNAVAGIPPSEWPTEARPLTRSEFEGLIAASLVTAFEDGRSPIEVSLEHASMLATRHLSAMLERHGVAFGSDDFEWDEDQASEEAAEILEALGKPAETAIDQANA